MFSTKIKEASLFAKNWVKNPLQLGALFQTSNTFAKTLVPEIDWSGEYVLELGAGLGNLTQVILETTNTHEKFGCVEVEENFYKHLKQKFPYINTQHGSAANLPQLFPHMVGKVRTIVSLIPMLSLPPKLRTAILSSCLQMLDKDGFILQGSYYWKPIAKNNNTNVDRIAFVWKNMPPIHLYKYTQKINNIRL